MTHLVISYRREDTRRQTQLIRERLASVFGEGRVFRDLDSIRLGTNFERSLNEALSNAAALFAVIGPGWLDVQGEHGKRRLDDPLDYVRLEIATALARDVRVVPVLVGDVRMPTETDLPGDMKALAVQQGIELSDDRFHQGVEELVRRSEELLGQPEGDAAGAAEQDKALEAENQELRASLKELESSVSKEKDRAESINKELHSAKSSLVSARRWKAAGIGLMAVLVVGSGLGWYGHRTVVTTLTAESGHLPKLLKESEEKNVKLAASLWQAGEEVKRLEQEAAAAKQRANSSLTELEERLADTQSKASELGDAKSDVDATLQATQNRLKESEADNDVLNRKLATADAQLAAITDRLAAYDTKLNEFEQVGENAGRAESELKVVRRQLDESRAESAGIQKALIAAQEDVEAAQQQAKTTSTGLELEVSDAEKRAVVLDAAKRDIEEKLQSALQRLTESEAANEVLNQELETAGAQLATLTDRLAVVDTKTKQIEQAMESVGSAESELKVAPSKATLFEPAMVIIPAGSFSMGSPETEQGRDDNEGPQRRVTIGKFAMGKYEVTLEEYDKFAEATGRQLPDDEGWGRGKRPVINVTWGEAVEYAKWLSRETGKRYRLPTEAEWEYAARAGTETAYWWGNDVERNRGNCDGCGSKWDGKQTAPVGSLKGNAYGLFDTAGNVWEWVQDCWNDNYNGAPKDGTAWLSGHCDLRVVRGGSWDDGPEFIRSAHRFRSPDRELQFLGFRLAQDL